jgi:hypothetical protein
MATNRQGGTKMARTIERRVGEYAHRENTIENLKRSGMVFPKSINVPDEFLDDDDFLVIPEDVTDIPTAELGRYLSIFTALTAYYDAVVACADIDYTAASRTLTFIEEKTLLDLPKGERGETLAEKKARRDMYKEVIEAQNWYDSQYSVFKLATAMLKGCERIVFMLSREITRRGVYTENFNRDDKVNKTIRHSLLEVDSDDK